MKLRLLREWMGKPPGTIMDIVDGAPGVKGQATLMIERRTAEKVTKPRKPRKPKPTQKQQTGAKNRAVNGAPVNK